MTRSIIAAGLHAGTATEQLHPCGTAVEMCNDHRRPVFYYFLTPWPVGEPYHEYVCEVGHIVRLVPDGQMPVQLSLFEGVV